MTIESATLALGLRSTAQSLGVIGRDLGIFATQHIDLQVVREETAGPEGIRGLTSGEYEFAELGTVPLVQAALEGADPVILLAAEHVSALYVLGRRGISSFTQLNGLQAGVLSSTGQTGYSANKMAERWGLAAGLRLKALGTYPAIYTALVAGEIDAGVLTADYKLAGEAQHDWSELADLGAEFGFQGPVLATTRRLAREQPDKVRAVVNAYLLSVRAFIQGGDEVVAALCRHLGFVDMAQAAAIHRFYAARFRPEPVAGNEGIDRVIRSFVDSYPQASRMSHVDVHDASFLQSSLFQEA